MTRSRTPSYLALLCLTLSVGTVAQIDSAQLHTPTVVSRVPSLHVEYTPLGSMSGIVTVHNLSDHAVIALRIGAWQGQNGWGQGANWDGRQPLIAPGASYQIHVTPPRSTRRIHGQFVEAPTSRTLVLQAALFEGGSYGGDVRVAAEMEAFQVGEKAEAQLIQAVVAPILASDQADSVKLQRIIVAVTPLSTDADAQMLSTLCARLPNLPDSACRTERNLRSFSHGMKDQKDEFLATLHENAQAMNRQRHPVPLAGWWNLGCSLCR